MTADNPITALLAAPLSPGWTVEGLAEQLLRAIVTQPSDGAQEFVLDPDAPPDRQTHRLLRPLLACLATKSAAEAGTPTSLYGGRVSFRRPGPHGPVWILGQFENRPGGVRVTLRRSSSPPEGPEARPGQRGALADGASRGDPSGKPPPGPDFGPPLAARLVQGALDYRINAEAESLSRLHKLPPADYSRLVEDLDALLGEMRRSSGDEFRNLDVRFHRRIAEAADNVPADLENAFAFNYQIGGMVASIEENRAAIVGEHQRIVDALRKRNFEEAAAASRRHLMHVFRRWCPDYDANVRRGNLSFFAPLGPGGALLWSGMVFPLEWKDWPTLGKAAAAAVGRGAELWYFAFAQSLLDRWRSKGLDLGVPDFNDMQEEFSGFQARMARELATLAGKPEDAPDVVRQRVLLLPLDDDTLFALTRTAQTLGYYLYADRPHALTQRVSLSGSVAWHEIEQIAADNDDGKKHFLLTLKEALEQLRLAAKGKPGAELAARCLGKIRGIQWPGPEAPAQPPAPLEKNES
jgi:hypothetical protein